MVMTLNSVKWNLDQSLTEATECHSVFTLFSCLIVPLSKRGKRGRVRGRECSPSLWLAWGLLPSSQLLASEQNPRLYYYMLRTREERFSTSVWSSEAFASYCFKKMEKKV